MAILMLLGFSEEEAIERINQMADGYAEDSPADDPKQPEEKLEATEEVPFDAEEIVQGDMPLDEKLDELDAEIEKYERQWEELEETLDEKDIPAARQEYDDYIDYVESMKDEAEYVEFEREFQEAVQTAAVEAKNQWIETQKADLVNTKEQISVLEAHIEGYGGSGYDTSEAERQLETFRERERELTSTLADENVDFNYTATEREPIGPSRTISKGMAEIEAERQRVMNEIKREQVMRKKKQIMRETIDEHRRTADAYLEEAATHDTLLTGAETIVAGADVSVEVMSNFTGPAGKAINTGYKATKNIATGATEAYLDPDNAASHLGTGVIKAVGDVAKHKIAAGSSGLKVVDKFKRLGIDISPEMGTKILQEGVTVVVDTSTGAVKGLMSSDGVLLGGAKGFGKGLADSALNVPGNMGLDKLGDSAVSKVAKGVGTYGLDQTKNYAKGESVIFSDWS
jgi:hypothetical protein